MWRKPKGQGLLRAMLKGAEPSAAAVPPADQEFALTGQTKEELAALERKEKTGEAKREKEEREIKELADRERDIFALQPTKAAPAPAAPPMRPTGDMFGATGMVGQPPRTAAAAPATPIEEAATTGAIDPEAVKNTIDSYVGDIRQGKSNWLPTVYDEANNTLTYVETWKTDEKIPREDFDELVAGALKTDTAQGAKYSILVKDTPTESLVLTFQPRGLKPTQKVVEVSMQMEEATVETPKRTYKEEVEFRRKERGLDDPNLSKKIQETKGVSKPVADAYVRALEEEAVALANLDYGKGTEEKFSEAAKEVRKIENRIQDIEQRAKGREGKPPTETVTPSEDKYIGLNVDGEKLYERKDGSRYRMRMDRADRPDGYPDFGGNLRPALPENVKPGTVIETIDLPDNMQVRILKATDGFSVQMYDKDSDNVVDKSVTIFKESVFEDNAFDSAKEYADNLVKEVRQEAEEAAPKAKPNFYMELLPKAGFTRLDIDDPRTYKNKSGDAFLTFERDGVRVAFESGNILYADDRGRVGRYMGNDSTSPEGADSVFAALLVDPKDRKQGKARKALQEIVKMADESNTNLYLEPASLDTEGMTTPQLKDFYRQFGFKPQETEPATDRVMIRKVGAKAETKKEPSSGPTFAGMQAELERLKKEQAALGISEAPLLVRDEKAARAEREAKEKKKREKTRKQAERSDIEFARFDDLDTNPIQATPEQLKMAKDLAAKVNGELVFFDKDLELGLVVVPADGFDNYFPIHGGKISKVDVSDYTGLSTLDKSFLNRVARVIKVFRDTKPGLDEFFNVEIDMPGDRQESLFGSTSEAKKVAEAMEPKGKKLPPGRSPELTAAARSVRAGTMTAEEYNKLVDVYKPIPMYAEPLRPATAEQVYDALDVKKREQINPDIPNGTKVGLRLDIPAFNRKGVFVVSIHQGRSVVKNRLQKAFATVNPGDKVSGLTVRKEVPNMGSIGATLENYEVLDGIRVVPITAFDKKYLDSLRKRGIDKRTSDLSDQIKQSKEINPLIVAIDNQGAYIIEGGHRFDALIMQGRDSVPAKVVIDNDNPPTKTASAPGKVIGYGSVAKAKNVTFGVGNQLKALDIAAGEAKDALQTIEGEYINITPEQAFAEAQRAIKDPSYVQVGIDPTRHAYFYDRNTTLPVVSAEEVIQIGNMILAKKPVFGAKSDFLYNIESQGVAGGSLPRSKKEIKEFLDRLSAEEDAKREVERQERIAYYASIRQKEVALQRRVRNYGSTIEIQRELNNLNQLAKELKEDIDLDKRPVYRAEEFLNQARAALEGAKFPYKEAKISPDVFAVIQAVYMDDPKLLEGLRLSIKPEFSPDETLLRRAHGMPQAAGAFVPFQRLVKLYTGTRGVDEPITIRHELTHTLEQMMTPAQRQAVISSYFKALEKAVKKHKDARSQEFFEKVTEFLNNPTGKIKSP